MAKAQFHKNQRVYVKPVGTWALIEHVVPHWAKGIDEPIRVHYDVGLGREFAAEELLSEEPVAELAPNGAQRWRVVRARNKWQPAEDCARHPVPGTYPVVITGEAEWGGWRVPGAEYDLNPQTGGNAGAADRQRAAACGLRQRIGGMGAQVGRRHAQCAGRAGAQRAGYSGARQRPGLKSIRRSET